MFTITIKTENEKAVAESLQSTEGRVRFACANGLARGLLIAVGNAQRNYLSGPRPEKLDVRTGRLRSNVASEVEVIGDRIIGRIGDNLPYAAFWEFGFHGTEHVRAHTRVRGWMNRRGQQLKTRRAVRRVIGQTIDSTTGKITNVLGDVAYYKDIRPAEVKLGLSNFSSIEQVKAHARKIYQDGKPYLRPALEETDIMGEVNKELRRITNG